MPWAYRLLRGRKVLARVDDAGAYLLEDGRAEVRFRPNDGRGYRAWPRNLSPHADAEVFPDEYCSTASFTSSGTIDAPTAVAAAKESKPVRVAKSSGPRCVAYADGACDGNPGPCGLGAVLLTIAPEAAQKQEELAEFLGPGTNNIGELTAILRVLQRAPLDMPLEVRTDSQYAIGVLSKGWKAKANQALIAEARAVIASRTARTQFVYVRGHAGEPGNERADALAGQATRTRSNSGWREVAVVLGA